MILKVPINVIGDLDEGSMAVLFILNFSAAFDVTEVFRMMFLCYRVKDLDVGKVVSNRQSILAYHSDPF